MELSNGFIELSNGFILGLLSLDFNVVFREVLAPCWQLVMLYGGQQVLQLSEERFAGEVLVGVHSERGGFVLSKRLKHLGIPGLEERGARYGNGLVSGREHGPTVGASLGDVERFALAEHLQDRQVVDVALGAGGEAESYRVRSFPVVEVAVLHANEFSVHIVVRCLQPVRAVAVFPRGEAAPADDARVEESVLVEKSSGSLVEPGPLEEALIAGRVERLGGDGLLSRFPLREDDVVLVGEPAAGVGEVLAEHPHGEVDDAARGPADEAAERVLPDEEGEAWMAVLMEGTQGFMPRNPEAESLRHPLDGERAEAL
jgi:hypothetical protein